MRSSRPLRTRSWFAPRGAVPGAPPVAGRLHGHRRPQPPHRRSGRRLPRGQGGAARGQRCRGGGARDPGIRGHRCLPAPAARDERGPGRARALLRGDGRTALGLRRAVRDGAGGDGRGVPRQRRQRDADGRDDVHAPPHDPLPARAREELSATTCRRRRAARLSLGLKAMRVLGIAPPRGPALEPGAEGGKVRRRGGGQ